MKDVSKHKEFMSQEVSIEVKALSENECIVYYFYKGVWPYPSSDIAAKMILHEDAIQKITTFTLTADPTLVEDKGIRRLDYFFLTYTFKDLEDGHVEVSATGKFTPAVQLPAFIASTWFPDGPAGYLKGILALAQEVR